MTYTERIKKWWKSLPDKKKYLEIVTALLSIPVLTTAILLNIGSLKDKDKEGNVAPAPAQQAGVTIIPVELKEKGTAPTGNQCRKETGPVEIVYPRDNQTVSENSVCIEVAQKSADYCSVQWSFKLDEGEWSAFTDRQFCFSNLAPGPHEVQVIVKSTASQDQTLIERRFNYKTSSAQPTPATTSAALD